MLGTRLPANTVQGMMDLCCQMLLDDGNTFYSQRVFDLFPQMATATGGTWTHTSDGGFLHGGEVRTNLTNDSNYIEWTVYVSAGAYVIKAIYLRNAVAAKADLTIDGGSVVDTHNQYGTSLQTTWTSAQFSVTEGYHTIRLTKNGKDAASGSYLLNYQHCQLIKQSAGSALGSVANVPHVIDIPIMFADSHTNWNTLYNQTTLPFGSMRSSSAAQNDSVTFSFWAPKGNATLAVLYQRGTGNGIMTVTVDGNSWGTGDLYGSALDGALNTDVSGSILTTGLHTITFTMATKNGSSSNYLARFYHVQIRMTSIAEPLALDLAPESVLFWPWFPESNSGFAIYQNSGSYAYYQRTVSSGTQNEYIQFSCALRPGTYRLDLLSGKDTDNGKYHLLVDGVDVGNVDGYAAGASHNDLLQITGITLSGFVTHTVQIKMATKNASSSAYYPRLTLARLIRTGA